MPQILTHIIKDLTNPNSLDWGTIIIFSCSSHCQPLDEEGNKQVYMDEFFIQQSFSESGMGDSLRKAHAKIQEESEKKKT